MKKFQALLSPDSEWGKKLVRKLEEVLTGNTVATFGQVSGSVTLDLSLADLTTLTLVGDVTLTLRPGVAGTPAWLEVAQDATGGHTVTLSGGTVPGWTMTATAGRKDLVGLVYSGTQWVGGVVASNYTG